MSTYPQTSSKKMNDRGKKKDNVRPLTMRQKYVPAHGPYTCTGRGRPQRLTLPLDTGRSPIAWQNFESL